jgi:hypothetical protein
MGTSTWLIGTAWKLALASAMPRPSEKLIACWRFLSKASEPLLDEIRSALNFSVSGITIAADWTASRGIRLYDTIAPICTK